MLKLEWSKINTFVCKLVALFWFIVILTNSIRRKNKSHKWRFFLSNDKLKLTNGTFFSIDLTKLIAVFEQLSCESSAELVAYVDWKQSWFIELVAVWYENLVLGIFWEYFSWFMFQLLTAFPLTGLAFYAIPQRIYETTAFQCGIHNYRSLNELVFVFWFNAFHLSAK